MSLQTFQTFLSQIYDDNIKHSWDKTPKYLRQIAAGFGLLTLSLSWRYILLKIWNEYIMKYPPGPIGLPCFGMGHEFGAKPWHFLIKIASYGPITYVPLMSSKNIFINDAKLLNKLYRNEIFSHRNICRNTIRKINDFGSLNGEIWLKRRQFVEKIFISKILHSKRMLSTIKYLFNNEIYDILDNEYCDNKQLWFPHKIMAFLILNSKFIDVFGISLSYKNDIEFIDKYIKSIYDYWRSVPLMIMADICVNFKIPDFILDKLHYENENIFNKILVEWMNNNGFEIDYDKNSIMNKNKDKLQNIYIDVLINAYNDRENNGLYQIVEECIVDIQAVIGQDTTSNVAEYAILLLAKYPFIQQKVYNELINVIQENNLNEFEYHIIHKLNIFKAFIHECLRISCVGPISAPHTNIKDYYVDYNDKKYFIPKGSIIHSNNYYMMKINQWNMNMNKSEKYEFNEEEDNNIHLEYWLNSDNIFVENDNFVLFGIGKRNCVGKPLVYTTLYSIFALLIMRYKFVEVNPIDIKQKWGTVPTIEPSIGVHIQKRQP